MKMIFGRDGLFERHPAFTLAVLALIYTVIDYLGGFIQ